MAAVSIITPTQTAKMSKIFRVVPGYAMVISSFYFRCAMTDDKGNVVTPADCAILHKLELESDLIPYVDDGCVECQRCVFENLGSKIINSEPVVQCGENWTHNAQNNLSVISVPGYYMFELCNDSSVGVAMMQVEELPIDQATLIPKALFHGEC